jgi:hypothetical protein
VAQDLNALIGGGTSIYTAQRFAHVAGAIDPSSELGQLLANPSPTATQLIRLNRLLLELGYNAELSKGVLAAYRLVQVPSSCNEVTAKAAWNLRVRRSVSFSPTLDAVRDFVNNGAPGFGPSPSNASDFYLRGGDLNGDSVVNLSDYNILRTNFGTTQPAGDINGDATVDILDYTLMQVNFSRSGDVDAK